MADGGFGAGIEAPSDDPFASTTSDEFQQEDPLAGAEGATTTPVVNAEGELIGEAPVQAEVVGVLQETDEEREMREHAEAEMDAASQQAEEAAAEVPPTAPTAGGETASSAASTETTTSSADAAPESDPTAADGPASSAIQKSQPETPPSPAAQAAPAAATSPGDAGPSSASATQAEDEPEVKTVPPGDSAPMPEERKDKSGATTHRRYVLLVPDGDGKHRELTWYEDKTGKMVKKGTVGAKKQSVVLAKNQEEALETAFLAAGSPAGGVSVRAVPYSYWGEVTRVELDEDPPVRQRLKIRR